MTLAMSGATRSDAGLASGLVNTSLQVGGALGAKMADPEREVAVCRELTKVHEEVVRGTAAESLASALNTLLYFGASSRAGKDEEVIMKNTNATQDGKKVVVNFSMPRQSAS